MLRSRVPRFLSMAKKDKGGPPFKLLKKRSSTFVEQGAEAAPLPSKLKLNFFSPYETFFEDKEVEMVLLNSSTQGQIGVLPGHIPIVAQLKPGVMHITNEGATKKFFVAGGFAVVKPNSSVDVASVEAFDLSEFDSSAVSKNLEKYQKQIEGAKDDTERTRAQVAVEVYYALDEALKAEGL